jgi:hypothetical protein
VPELVLHDLDGVLARRQDGEHASAAAVRGALTIIMMRSQSAAAAAAANTFGASTVSTRCVP